MKERKILYKVYGIWYLVLDTRRWDEGKEIKAVTIGRAVELNHMKKINIEIKRTHKRMKTEKRKEVETVRMGDKGNK